MIDIPYFKEKKQLFDFLIENKEILIAQKKAIVKHAYGFTFNNIFSTKGDAYKEYNPVDLNTDMLKVRAIINTTNYMDNHRDVHIPGLWKKSLRENKMIMHIQEHKMSFESIISEGSNLKAYTQNYTWKELGAKFEGETEALVFDSVVKETGKMPRNPYMFEQYAKGYVKNHSVGMRYIKLVMAVNDEAYGAEFEAWEKYFPMVVNQDEAEKAGYFWAVPEAKAIEGSAVPIGSNMITPTQENDLKSEPLEHSEEEPSFDTLDYTYLTKNFSLQ